MLASLRAQGQYKHLVTGAPVAPRSAGGWAGQYSGVAVVSSVPSRALSACWPPDLFDTGRVQVVSSFLHNMWVTGAVAYGYPQSKTHSNATQRTLDLLAFLVTYLTQVASGPRYFCGDWNLAPDQLPFTDQLRALGWWECQDLHFHQTGQPPQNTCKMKTRKDYLWISPELVPLFAGLTVHHDRFPDHSALVASFVADPKGVVKYLWPQPVAVPWNTFPDHEPPVDFSQGSPTDQYRALWASQEQQAQRVMKSKWQRSMAGRGCQTDPKKKTGPWIFNPSFLDFMCNMHDG